MIGEFQGKFRFLSNFYPVDVIFDGEIYPSVEHAYQAAKTLDRTWRKKIREASTPGKAKRLGKFAPLRKDWDEAKLAIMEYLTRQKFSDGHPSLKSQLLETKEIYLMEGNKWGDTFWGVCKDIGENHLGKIIMKIREEII